MNDSAQVARRAQISRFMKKGVIMAISTGILYGIYSSCLLAATGSGEWNAWYGAIEGLPGYGWYAAGSDAIFTNTLGTYAAPVGFVMAVIILGALGSGLNDFVSALWMMGKAGVKGKFMDFLRCLKSKPGAVMMVCAFIGGPIASTAYLIALVMSGPIATPISALCPAIGAIIGRLFLKQQLNARMMVGILVCVLATFMIGSTAFGGVEVNTTFLIGLAIAFISALGWGIEGSVGGFGATAIDYEISVTIRQVVSGVFTLFILVPALFIFAGQFGLYPTILIESLQGPLFLEGTFMIGNPLIYLLISGLASGLSFGFWYKANSMCGTALGMACNGAFSFWVPFFSFLVCGLYLGWAFDPVTGAIDPATGYALYPIQWAAAIVMVVGIFLIAVNPLDWFKKKEAV